MSPFEVEAAGEPEAVTLDDIELEIKQDGQAIDGREEHDGTKVNLTALPPIQIPLVPIRTGLADCRMGIFGVIGQSGANSNRLGILRTSSHFEALFSGEIDGIKVDVFGFKPVPDAEEFVGDCKIVLSLGGKSVEHDVHRLEDLNSTVPNALSHRLIEVLKVPFAEWERRKFIGRRGR